ncbi:hypothetical protein Bca52824_094774 [Brassica carinata]|uniref:HSF-type DNA-binding domain-containing protein n=1 Tax=Brassica carinata TaxID=52824 RepID=A0A8X7P2Y9_BRACI|nr:hypothetical protein Bca52824_094774 [Brassica carinata]
MSSFYSDIYEVVDDPSLDSIISWSKSNKSFVIWDQKELVEKIFPRLLHYKLSHFITEIEIYGFVRIEGSEHLEFGHEQYFVRGKPELLTKMRYQAVSNMVKKGREEQEKKISVGDQMMSGRYVPIRFNNKIKRSPLIIFFFFSVITTCDNLFSNSLHLL